MHRKTTHQLPSTETVLIAGGSGYLGRSLVMQLLSHGHRVLVATRKPSQLLQSKDFPVDKRLAVFELYKQPPWQPTVIINLCGENIAGKRWSSKRKQQLLDSRLKPSQWLAESAGRSWPNVHCFINASAIGIYGDHRHRWISENSSTGSDFSAELCTHWESSTKNLAEHIRVAHARLAVVIGEPRKGSFLGRLLPSYRLGLGAQIDNGRHWFSWIDRQDAARALVFIVEQRHCHGHYNLSSPQPVQYAELHKRLSALSRLPNLLRLPAWLIRLLFGEMAELLLNSQRIKPQQLLSDGFTFDRPAISGALRFAIDGHAGAKERLAAKQLPEANQRTMPTAQTAERRS